MSRSLLEAKVPEAAPSPLRRWLRVAGRDPVRTLFLQPGKAWSYERGSERAQCFQPADAWLEAHSGGNVRLVLSGALTHQLVVSDPMLPIESTEALLEWARHQFVHYHGQAARQWTLSSWTDGQRRCASAAHGIDLDALVRQASAHDVKVRAAQPWWAVALQAATHAAPTLALAERAELWLVEGSQVTRVTCGQGRVLHIDQHWLARADSAALASLMRECGPLCQSSWVLGYGLGDNDEAALGVRCLGTLSGDHPAARWLGA